MIIHALIHIIIVKDTVVKLVNIGMELHVQLLQVHLPIVVKLVYITANHVKVDHIYLMEPVQLKVIIIYMEHPQLFQEVIVFN